MWREWPDRIRVSLVTQMRNSGHMLKDVAFELNVSRSTVTALSRKNKIIWARGARDGNKNAEIHGQGHNTIKRLTRRVLLANDRDITICERCKWKQPLGESLARHHKDRNRLNNDISNLEVLCHSCHSLEHKDDRPRNQAGQFQTNNDNR